MSPVEKVELADLAALVFQVIAYFAYGFFRRGK